MKWLDVYKYLSIYFKMISIHNIHYGVQEIKLVDVNLQKYYSRFFKLESHHFNMN